MVKSSSEFAVQISNNNDAAITAAATPASVASTPDDSLLAYSSDESGFHSDAYFSSQYHHFSHASLTYSPTSSPDPNNSSLFGSGTVNKKTTTNKKGFNNNNTYGSFEPSSFSEGGNAFLHNVIEEDSDFRIPMMPFGATSVSNKNNALFQIEQFPPTPQNAWLSHYHYQYYHNYYYHNNNNTGRDNYIIASSSPSSPSSTTTLQHHHNVSTSNSADLSAQRRTLRCKHKEQEARENLVRQVRGTNQSEEEWKDVKWLILFFLHLLAVVFCAIRYGSNSIFTPRSVEVFPSGVDENTLGNIHQNIISLDKSNSLTEVATNIASQLFHIDYQTALEVIIIAGLYACVLSALTIGFMLILSRSLLQTA